MASFHAPCDRVGFGRRRAILHAVHVQRDAWIQNIAVIAKLLLIVIFLAWAGAFLQPTPGNQVAKASLTGYAVSLVSWQIPVA